MRQPGDRLVRSYGRRRGRRLRAGQARLLAEALPGVALDPGETTLLDPQKLFSFQPRALWLEIGFGAGEHLAQMASAHRDVGFIGCEPFVNGVAALLSAMRAQHLANIRIWTEDVRALLPRLPPRSLGRVFILFPDPWPKARHHKRRLIQTELLDALAQATAPDGELRLATDHADYLAWMLERLTAHRDFAWTARRPEDWRQRPADQRETRYEAKARTAGRACVYLRFVRRN